MYIVNSLVYNLALLYNARAMLLFKFNFLYVNQMFLSNCKRFIKWTIKNNKLKISLAT